MFEELGRGMMAAGAVIDAVMTPGVTVLVAMILVVAVCCWAIVRGGARGRLPLDDEPDHPHPGHRAFQGWVGGGPPPDFRNHPSAGSQHRPPPPTTGSGVKPNPPKVVHIHHHHNTLH